MIVAEFMDVIHTILRICKKNEGQCSVCILGEFACPNNARFDKTEEAAFCELKDVVVKWAEENPELVYPTWEEWLIAQGVIKENPNGVGWPMPKLFETISADIAQKLEIEPKEK